MSTFNCGERVRILDSDNGHERIYLVKDKRKCRNGGTLYLLKSLEEKSVLRLYHEAGYSLLERIS